VALHALSEPAGHRGRGPLALLHQQQGHLVAAEAGHRVIGASRFPQELCRSPQQRVPGQVAGGVVDQRASARAPARASQAWSGTTRSMRWITSGGPARGGTPVVAGTRAAPGRVPEPPRLLVWAWARKPIASGPPVRDPAPGGLDIAGRRPGNGPLRLLDPRSRTAPAGSSGSPGGRGHEP